MLEISQEVSYILCGPASCVDCLLGVSKLIGLWQINLDQGTVPAQYTWYACPYSITVCMFAQQEPNTDSPVQLR